MTLGQRIADLRKKMKFSQSELGKRVGTSGDIIGRYERDEVKPSIEVAAKIADVLNHAVYVSYLRTGSRRNRKPYQQAWKRSVPA